MGVPPASLAMEKATVPAGVVPVVPHEPELETTAVNDTLVPATSGLPAWQRPCGSRRQ